FLPNAKVLIHSHECKVDGATFFSLEDVAKSDFVILAVPISAFEDVLTKIVPLMGERTVLIDVATVKVHTVNLLKRIAKGKRYLATHPVWGPESYEKSGGNVKGFRIIMVDGTLAIDEYTSLTQSLKKCGFDVIEMSADE